MSLRLRLRKHKREPIWETVVIRHGGDVLRLTVREISPQGEIEVDIDAPAAFRVGRSLPPGLKVGFERRKK